MLPSSPRVFAVGALLVLTTLLVAACDVNGVSGPPPAVIHFKAYYFQQFYAPSFSTATSPVCASVPAPSDQYWYVYVEVDGIDNSTAGATDFTYDPANLKPKSSTATAQYLLTGYLDGYWQPQKVDVPAGQKIDVSAIHQGEIFLIDFGQSTPASSLSDYPPVLYAPTSPPGTLMSADPHQTIDPPDSAQPTNVSLADVHDVPLVTAGPCS